LLKTRVFVILDPLTKLLAILEFVVEYIAEGFWLGRMREEVEMISRKIAPILACLAIFAFIASGCVDTKSIKKLENEVSRLNQIIQQKDAKIKMLTEQGQLKQESLDSITKELDSVKKELNSTKKELDSMNKKLNTLTANPVTLKK